MSDNIIITSTRNSRVVNARKLSQRKHRSKQGRFLVQGQQLIWMALDARYEIDEVFYNPDLPDNHDETHQLLERLADSGTNLIQVAPEILSSLSSRDDKQMITGTVKQQSLSLREVTLPVTPLILILDRLQDCGNVGTMIRTADAAGAAAVILLTPSADHYDPRAVRSSMGSLFNLPVIPVHHLDVLESWLNANNLRLVGADAHQGRIWGKDALSGSVALCMGNEARGLSSDIRKAVDAWVRLPVAGKADSLNVAVAGGIFMYLWMRENT